MDYDAIEQMLKARQFAAVVSAIGDEQLGDFRLRIMKSVALGQLGRFAEGLQNLDVDVPGSYEQTALWVTRANLHLLAGNLTQAHEAASKALELTPGRSEAVIIASRVLVYSRRHQEAIALLEGQNRELSISEKLTLAIAHYEVQRSEQIESDILDLSSKSPDGGAAIMAADAFSRAGRNRAALAVLERWKFTFLEATGIYAVALIKTGNLRKAFDFALDDRVHYYAKAEVFCALRDPVNMRAIQPKVEHSDQAWPLLQKESLLPRSEITVGDPPAGSQLRSMIQKFTYGVGSTDLAIAAMRMALETSKPIMIQGLLRELRQLTPAELPQIDELIGLLKSAKLISEKDVIWWGYKSLFVSGNYAAAWAKLAEFKKEVVNPLSVQAETIHEEPEVPLKREHIEAELPIILIFGMSRSGKSRLATRIANAAPGYMFLDELNVTSQLDAKTIRSNLRLLKTIHPGGIILTVPHPRETHFINLVGGAQVKTVVVHRDINDLAFAMYEKDYANKTTHAYAFSFAASEKRARIYQDRMSSVILKEGNGHLIRYEDFGSREKMAELSNYLGIGELEPLHPRDAGISNVFRAEMESALKNAV